MQISTQLFIGAQEKKDFSPEHIRQRIAGAKKHANIQSLMIWADDDPNAYQNIVRICKNYDIKSYLWFPVLADIPGYDMQEEELVVSYEDKRGHGKIGRWEQLGKGDEEFLFICPNNTPALNRVFHVYKNLVDQVDFDGVFLDRIRYPSCTNGFESLFTCFCGFCQEKFSDRYDVPLNSFRQTIAAFVESLKRVTAEDFNQHKSLESLWNSAGLKKFFEFRDKNIYDVVKTFSDYARSQYKHVGLDVYTPSLAPFVSQNYQMLADCCEWIKPMSYCHVIGPAGVPLEISCLIRALKMLCPLVSERNIIRFFERVLRVTLPERAQEIIDHGIPEAFVARELDKINTLQLPDDVHIYPGIEAVKNPHFSLSIDKDILEKYIAHIQQKTNGVIASWNLLYIPDENLDFLGVIC